MTNSVNPWVDVSIQSLVKALSTAPRKATSFELARGILKASRRLGAISLSYHLVPQFSSVIGCRSFTYFASDRALSHSQPSEEIAAAVSTCHRYVISCGRPVSLAVATEHFRSDEPELIAKITDKDSDKGVIDEFMVPVFGPYGLNAVISFGFDCSVAEVDPTTLVLLESFSSAVHNGLVAYYSDATVEKAGLSDRENEVLKWIARGKSSSDIATILDLSASSIDTYTRRVFKKLGVHDRVSAAISGISQGVIAA